MGSLFLLYLMTFSGSLSQASFNGPELQKGPFEYQGDFTAIIHDCFEYLYGQTPENEARVAALRAEGFDCGLRGSSDYLCNQRLPVDAHDPIAANLVEKNYAGYRVKFYQEFKQVMRINSEIFRQWQVEQKVLIQKPGHEVQVTYNVIYTWDQLADHVYPGDSEDAPEREIYQVNSEGLKIPAMFDIKSTANRTDRYFVNVQLKRQIELDPLVTTHATTRGAP